MWLDPQDFVVLEYADPGTNLDVGQPPPIEGMPLLRYHSESVFNRFPVKNPLYRHRYQRSVLKIVENGWGIISLFFHDGRGRGLGSIFVDRSSRGMVEDTRDFAGATWVMKRHLRGVAAVRVLGSRDHPAITDALLEHGVAVREWVYVGDPVTDKGHALLRERISAIPERIMETLGSPVPPLPGSELLGSADFVITGVGSSEAHSHYLAQLLRDYTPHTARFVPLEAFLHESALVTTMTTTPPPARRSRPSVLVVFSQGLSPNSWAALGHMDSFDRVVLFTAVTDASHSPKKLSWLERTRAHAGGGVVVTFPLEDEYGILVRVVGPIAGFLRAYQCVRSWFSPDLPDPAMVLPMVKRADETRAPEAFVRALKSDQLRDLQILAPYPMSGYMLNAAKKFEEGMMLITPTVSDYLSFPHGRHQLLIGRYTTKGKAGDPQAAVLIFDSGRTSDGRIVPLAREMTDGVIPTWTLRSVLPIPLQVIEFEAILNHLMLTIVEDLAVDQCHWPGHDRESPLYHVSS